MEAAPVAAVLTFDLILLLVVLFGRKSKGSRAAQSSLIAALFFCSGFPALIYQIVWQRALFAIYGVNVQSVAVVVSAFMLGLGLGSLVGGWLSEKFPDRGILIFGVCELAVAGFGLISLRLFHWVSGFTAGSSLGITILFSFLLLILPTMLMGATLPLLVEQLVRSSRDVGYSVATLYFVNTLGSAVACFVCAQVLMRNFGQSGSVTVAACLNALVGVTAFLYGRSQRPLIQEEVKRESADPARSANTLGLRTAAAMAGVAGFLALGFEIAWFRIFALATSDRAPAFALLLATYLAGIAAGSFLSETLCERKKINPVSLAGVSMLVAGIISVYLPPLLADLSWHNIPALMGAPAFFLTACFLGSVLPLLCQASVSAGDSAGRSVSLIYVSNIIGSTLGSLIIGFVVMNYSSTQAIASELAGAAIVTGAALILFRSGRFQLPTRAWALVFPAAAIAVSAPAYSNLYGKMIFGPKASQVGYMKHLVENRNGIVAVTADDAVFGGGV